MNALTSSGALKRLRAAWASRSRPVETGQVRRRSDGVCLLVVGSRYEYGHSWLVKSSPISHYWLESDAALRAMEIV